MRRIKRRYLLIYDLLNEKRDLEKEFLEKYLRIFGEVNLIRSEIKFLKLKNGFSLISFRKEFKDNVLACLSIVDGVVSLRICGTIRKGRKVMKEWSSKLWDMIGQ